MTESLEPVCPLCGAAESTFYCQDKRRNYLQCHVCQLVWVPAAAQISAAAEKAEYDKHQNDPADSGYRAFLSRTLNPLLPRLPAGAKGLDFGCGPGPTLSLMAKEQGVHMANYDLYYFHRPELLIQRYDFITLTEVIEHIADPAKLLAQLDRMLRDQGLLAIMTKRVSSQSAFAYWHYKNDPTHICFYSEATFAWIGAKMQWQLEVIDKDVVFFQINR